MNNVNVAKLYIKPSLIKNFGKAGVETSSQIVNNLKIIENQTLVRGELGGSFDFGNGWSGFSAVGYTVGSDYDATDFNLGVNYNW